jgi:hypothetical protein
VLFSCPTNSPVRAPPCAIRQKQSSACSPLGAFYALTPAVCLRCQQLQHRNSRLAHQLVEKRDQADAAITKFVARLVL